MLRADGERMERLIAGLTAASHQAEEAVGDLKDTAGQAGRQLQAAIDKAQSLIADLQFMNDKAEIAADRLDGSLREQREASLAAATLPPKVPRRPAESRPADVAATLAERAAAERGTRRAEPVGDGDRGAIGLDQTDREIHNRLASLLKQAEASTRAPRGKPTPARQPAPAMPAEPAEEAARPIALQSRSEREFMKAMEARK
jgi:pyruvate/2-oxoglutarate dehydrogenase complex dihydrolipoamide acyltransferase (E2) component